MPTVMKPRVKQFLELNNEVIQNGDLRQLFVNALEDEFALDHYDAINLTECLEQAGITTTDVRQDVLYDLVSDKLQEIVLLRATSQNRSVMNVFFNHCNNLVGFSLLDVIDFLHLNEFNFGIHLTPKRTQYSLTDFIIDFL